MKTKLLVIALVLVLGISTVFAASGSARLTINTKAQLNGTTLEPGSYKLSWTGDGDKVQVTFKKGKHEFTAPAKLVQISKPLYSAVVTDKSGAVREIWLEGKTTSLVFTE